MFAYEIDNELLLLIFHVEAIHDFANCTRTENGVITPEYISNLIPISKWSSILPIIDGYTETGCDSTGKKIAGFEDKVIKYIKSKNPITDLLLDDNITPVIHVTNSSECYSFNESSYKLTVELSVDQEIIDSKIETVHLYRHKENLCQFLVEFYGDNMEMIVDTENFVKLDSLFNYVETYLQRVDESNKYDMAHTRLSNNIIEHCTYPHRVHLLNNPKLKYDNLGVQTTLNFTKRVDHFLDTQYGVELHTNPIDLSTLIHLPSLLEMVDKHLGIYLVNNREQPVCEGGIIIYNHTTHNSVYIHANIAHTFIRENSLGVKRLSDELHTQNIHSDLAIILEHLALGGDPFNTSNTSLDVYKAYLIFDIKRCGDFGQIYNCKHFNKIFVTIDKLAHMYARLVGCNIILLSKRKGIPVMIIHRNTDKIYTPTDVINLIYDKFTYSLSAIDTTLMFLNRIFLSKIHYESSEYGTPEIYILFRIIDIILHTFHKFANDKFKAISLYISEQIPVGTNKHDVIEILRTNQKILTEIGYANDVTRLDTQHINILEYTKSSLELLLTNIPVLQLQKYITQIVRTINTPGKLLNSYINKLVDYVNYFNMTSIKFTLPIGDNIINKFQNYCNSLDMPKSNIPIITHFVGGTKPILVKPRYKIILRYHPTHSSQHSFDIYNYIFSDDATLVETMWKLIDEHKLHHILQRNEPRYIIQKFTDDLVNLYNAVYENALIDKGNEMLSYIIKILSENGLLPKYNNTLLKSVNNKIYNLTKHMNSIEFYDDYEWHDEISEFNTKINNMCRLQYLMLYGNYKPNRNFINNLLHSSKKTIHTLDVAYDRFYYDYKIQTILVTNFEYFLENYQIFKNIAYSLTLLCTNYFNYGYTDRSDWVKFQINI